MAHNDKQDSPQGAAFRYPRRVKQSSLHPEIGASMDGTVCIPGTATKRSRTKNTLCLLLAAVCLIFTFTSVARAATFLEQFLGDVPVNRMVADADGYGPIAEDMPVAPILRDGENVGYAYITTDFVGTTGYSGKPIHVMVAVAPDGMVLAAELVKHSEPIVLIGIPDSKIKALTESYAGLDLVAEATAGGSAHELNIVSGATVTVMVIDDSIVRSGLKVARALGLGGLAPDLAQAGPQREIDPTVKAGRGWTALSGDGGVRRLSLDVGQINAAFEASGDAEAAARPEKGDASETFIDMQAALISVPAIGKSLLGDAEFKNLTDWLKPGEHAILVVGRGRYSFKGSGYVRGGIFDRIQLIQGDRSVRFRDRDHRRLGDLAPSDAPSFTELDMFKIPADPGFEPTEPWRIQLLVQRPIGAIQRSYQTFDLAYTLSDAYTRPLPGAAQAAGTVVTQTDAEAEAAAKRALWQRIWRDNIFPIAALLAMLGVQTAPSSVRNS